MSDPEQLKFPGIGDRIFTALTRQEITYLIDILFEILPDQLRDQALAQLHPDTCQTLQQLLTPDDTISTSSTPTIEPVSLAKLAQSWSDLWNEWNTIVQEATQEESCYIEQDAEWEPPYFNSDAFIGDLDEVAVRMQPLIPLAFEHQFSPNQSFSQVLQEIYTEINDVVPEWILSEDEEFSLGSHLTTCLLQWEWLEIQSQGQTAFRLAQQIRQWEGLYGSMLLDEDALVEFFTELTQTDQECILAGMIAEQETPLWQRCLNQVHSHWHFLYKYLVGQFAPERHLDLLRSTISQQWQNGLPVIEDALNQEDYATAQQLIEETLDTLIESQRKELNWTPETSLLLTFMNRSRDPNENWEKEKTLLRYFRQVAAAQHQTEQVEALNLQLIAFDHWTEWQAMFAAFAEASVSESTHQALFRSWQTHILQLVRPNLWKPQTDPLNQDWWLVWLIECITDPQKGDSWFGQQITQWLADLSQKGKILEDDYHNLRLLSRDLAEIGNDLKTRYPKFLEVVIEHRALSTPDRASRQVYLGQYGPDDLGDKVMAYWQDHLHLWVPEPGSTKGSDYRLQAEWMEALQEVAPHSYQKLLDRWRQDHRRRRNLWKALESRGLS